MSNTLSEDNIKALKSIDKIIGTSNLESEIDSEFEKDDEKDLTTSKVEDKVEEFKGFQAPIKGSFYNSGNFSPGVKTDEKHAKGHDGVDLRAPAGTPLYPIMPGTVDRIGSTPIGGNTIYIKHDKGLVTYYAHCATINVQKGDIVGYNTQVATVGDTGNAKGTYPHLHFEVKQNGSLVNPSRFFSIPPYSDPEKSEKKWLSEDAKKEAEDFDFQKHVSKKQDEKQKKEASYLFKKNERLNKIASQFNKLSTKFNKKYKYL